MDKKLMALLATKFWSPDQLAGLRHSKISRLSPNQLAWLSPDQLAWLSPDQLSWLSPNQLARLSPDQLAGLSPDQLAGLRHSQISRLSPDQLAGLSPDQLSGLSPDQLSGLRPSQLARLGSAKNIPVVKSLYSSMLADIKAEKRKIDQARFGPGSQEEIKNLCDTPMCIAGHTVNLAGAEGYKLKSIFYFPVAAGMIHRASRPDAPEPRYDTYPTEWAMAYIEARASEEK